jgi:VIT1/CCC1 family predicted Fe2+/Mn2+ transporter
MKNLRNSVGLLVGVLIGSMINGLLIQISGSIIAPPEGADLTTEHGLIEAMNRFEFRHFIMPFLAHALGTFIGAYFTSRIAVSYRLALALSVGLLFFVGGVIMVVILPSPMWFTVVDLVVAYFPMAWLGWKLSGKRICVD